MTEIEERLETLSLRIECFAERFEETEPKPEALEHLTRAMDAMNRGRKRRLRKGLSADIEEAHLALDKAFGVLAS